MKTQIGILLMMFCALCGCDSATKELTRSKAQRALDLFAEDHGKVKVTGIRAGKSSGAESMASDLSGMTIVEIELIDFKFKNYNRQEIYSGPALCGFTGYTDGRWTLKWVGTEKGALNFGANITVE